MKIIIIMNWISKKLYKSFLLITFLIFSAIYCIGQNTDPYNFNELENLFEAHKHELPRYKGKTNKPKNEMEFVLASGFNVYKAFFSSQDNPSCIFYPSCSSYSVLAIQQKGLLVGTLSTFDRLSRCHRLVKANEYYFDPSKQRFYDPIK